MATRGLAQKRRRCSVVGSFSMLRTLGKGPKKQDRTLLGRLHDCHERIREMTTLATRLGSDPRPSDEEIVEAAERVQRYFSRSLPNHVHDEETSISPRL